MFTILEKLLVFILEGAKDAPGDGGAEVLPNRNHKKPVVILSVLTIIGIGIWYVWYDSYVKNALEIAKIQEAQSKRVIADLQRANLSLKDERIRLAADVRRVTDNLTTVTRERDKLQNAYDRVVVTLKSEQTVVTKQVEQLSNLKYQIEKLQLQLDTYAKDNRIIWDEIVTLGKEEGT